MIVRFVQGERHQQHPWQVGRHQKILAPCHMRHTLPRVVLAVRKHPLARRAMSKPISADNACPRCNSPFGEGANRKVGRIGYKVAGRRWT